MKINKKIVVLLIIFVLLAIGAFFILNKNNKSVELIDFVGDEEVFYCDSLNYSRLSFFNGSKDRVSLNIPEAWEGNYRLREEGDKAVFYHLFEDGSASKMFSINKKTNSSNSDDIICEKENLKFVLFVYDLEFGEDDDGIMDVLKCITKSIKCY